MTAETIVPGRSCGTCALCCKVLGVAEAESPPNVWCRHVVQGRGCAIHPSRPEPCRTFFCHWLQNPNLGPEWKPERAKFVLYTEALGRRLVVASDAAQPAAWRRTPYYAQFKRWAALGAASNRQVIVFNGRQATAVLPDRDQELGDIGLGDELIYRPGPGRIDVEVRRRSLGSSGGPE